MAFASRYSTPQRTEETASPKQREALLKRKAEYLDRFNKRLDRLPDSPEKAELIDFRDHCISKFPLLPVDLSIWIVAYFDDWNRRFDQVVEALEQ